MNDLKTVDIVFATTQQTHSGMLASGLIRTRTQLYQEVYIGPQDNELWKAVCTACRPRGYSFDPVLQFGQLYAFWNENPGKPSEYIWDPDQSLASAVVLSRLIHPTSTGFEYSARVMFSSDGKVEKIIPGPVSGLLAQAYVAPPVTRNWLTDNEASDLHDLLIDYHAISTNLPPRIKRALWNHEYAAACYWEEIRWTIIATALESLVHTDRDRSTKQFVHRVAALADRVGVNFTQDDAKNAYDNRSTLAHGQEVAPGENATTALYCRMEAVLRSAVRTAIHDATFRAIFDSDDNIRAEFPLSP